MAEVMNSIDKGRALSIAYHDFSKNLIVFYSVPITRFTIYMGGISRQLMLRSPADDHGAEDSLEISSDICNVLIKDLDDEAACAFSKHATDTKPEPGIKCWRAGLQLKGT